MFKLINNRHVTQSVSNLYVHIFYFLRSFLNSFKVINNHKNFYIPNLAINNIIYIDPKKIKYQNSIPIKYKNKSNIFIKNFDWDKKNVPLIEFEKTNHTSITCKQLFVDGFKIINCKEYFIFKEKIFKFGSFKNCRNENEVILYFKNLINIFENIKKSGIKIKIDNNIEFMIDRKLNLVKINGGNHRFYMSRILNLNLIPVEVKIIHSNCFDGDYDKNLNIKKLNKFLKKIENLYN